MRTVFERGRTKHTTKTAALEPLLLAHCFAKHRTERKLSAFYRLPSTTTRFACLRNIEETLLGN